MKLVQLRLQILMIVFIIAIGMLQIFTTGCNNKSDSAKSNKQRQENVNVAGNWIYSDQVYKIQLSISSIGTYYYSDDVGSSSGKWVLERNALDLIDNQDGTAQHWTVIDNNRMTRGNFTLKRQ